MVLRSTSVENWVKFLLMGVCVYIYIYINNFIQSRSKLFNWSLLFTISEDMRERSEILNY